METRTDKRPSDKRPTRIRSDRTRRRRSKTHPPRRTKKRHLPLTRNLPADSRQTSQHPHRNGKSSFPRKLRHLSQPSQPPSRLTAMYYPTTTLCYTTPATIKGGTCQKSDQVIGNLDELGIPPEVRKSLLQQVEGYLAGRPNSSTPPPATAAPEQTYGNIRKGKVYELGNYYYWSYYRYCCSHHRRNTGTLYTKGNSLAVVAFYA